MQSIFLSWGVSSIQPQDVAYFSVPPSCLHSQATPQRCGGNLPHLGRAFTDIQEMKQVTGFALGLSSNFPKHCTSNLSCFNLFFIYDVDVGTNINVGNYWGNTVYFVSNSGCWRHRLYSEGSGGIWGAIGQVGVHGGHERIRWVCSNVHYWGPVWKGL